MHSRHFSQYGIRSMISGAVDSIDVKCIQLETEKYGAINHRNQTNKSHDVPGSFEAGRSCNDVVEPGPPSTFKRFSGWRHELQSKEICSSICVLRSSEEHLNFVFSRIQHHLL